MTLSSNLMTEGSIWKKITFFALPIFLGNLFQQLYNTVDSLIVGNYLGSNALAAVSSSGSITFMLIGFLSGVATGGSVIIARYFGAKDELNMKIAIHTTVAFGLVASVIMTILGVYFTPVVLRLMDTPSVVMHDSITYLQMYFWGSFGVVMYNIFVGILQAIGDSKHPLYYLVISSIINIVLDIIFIRYMNMGVMGAAVATVISQCISALLCFVQLITTKENYRVIIKNIGFDFPMFKKIINYGLPAGLQNSIIAFANVIVQSNINSFGEMAMAGVGAYAKIEGFAFLPINSFTLALTTFIGQNLGASKFERAKKGASFGIIISCLLSELIGVIMFIFAPILISAFDSNEIVVSFGVDKLRSCALFYFLLAYSHANAAILRGAGKSAIPMFVMMVCWCIIRVAFLMIMVPLTQNIWTVYIVYPITWTLSSIAFFIYYHKVNWLYG